MSLHSSHQGSQWREHQDTQRQITNGEITSGEKSEGYRLFCKTDVAATLQDSCAFVDLSKEFRWQKIAIPLSATGGVDRTPCRTHIFLSLVASRMSLSTLNFHAHMRVAHGSRCSQELCCPFAHSKIISYHSMFHRTLLGVPDISRPLTGIRSTPCATSLEGMQSGHLAEPLPHTKNGDTVKVLERAVERRMKDLQAKKGRSTEADDGNWKLARTRKKVEPAAGVTGKRKALETQRCQRGVKCLEAVHQKKKATGIA